jgi:probable rRNA maturation factor
LRRIVRATLLEDLQLNEYQLGVYLVGSDTITHLNESFLRHRGSTDVITFDYGGRLAASLAGEVFVCVDEAINQAPRFRSTWQAEIVRYVVHGILHLSGYNDGNPASRRRMKRAENKILHRLAARFNFALLGRQGR